MKSKKNIHLFYSGKNKQHTLKSLLVVNQANGEIICTAHGKGKEHDLRIFNQGKLRFRQDIQCLGDKGYQGILKFHLLSRIPKNKPRGGKLNHQDKKTNQDLAKVRVVCELYQSEA